MIESCIQHVGYSERLIFYEEHTFEILCQHGSLSIGAYRKTNSKESE